MEAFSMKQSFIQFYKKDMEDESNCRNIVQLKNKTESRELIII